MSRWFSIFLYLGCLLAFVQASESTGEGGGIPGALKRAVKTYLHGGALPVDYERRTAKDTEDGVIRVNDSNSAELFSSPGENVYVIVVHGRDSDFLPAAFEEAHANVTKRWKKEIADTEDPAAKAELERFKFGRLDYYNDWVTCTRLLITKPPYLLFVSENDGKTEYRFLAFPSFPADDEKMYKLVKDGYWKRIRPWSSRFHPVDGEWAHLVQKYIAAWQYIGQYTKNLPVWSWIFLSMGMAGITQAAQAWFFRNQPAGPAAQQPATRR